MLLGADGGVIPAELRRCSLPSSSESPAHTRSQRAHLNQTPGDLTKQQNHKRKWTERTGGTYRTVELCVAGIVAPVPKHTAQEGGEIVGHRILSTFRRAPIV
jgi:aromatic ring hydroxylase